MVKGFEAYDFASSIMHECEQYAPTKGATTTLISRSLGQELTRPPDFFFTFFRTTKSVRLHLSIESVGH